MEGASTTRPIYLPSHISHRHAEIHEVNLCPPCFALSTSRRLTLRNAAFGGAFVTVALADYWGKAPELACALVATALRLVPMPAFVSVGMATATGISSES